METTYFGLFALITTYILLISLKNTTFLLLLSSNVGKVAEFWTLTLPSHLRISPNNCVYLRYYEPNVCVDICHNLETMKLITLLITDQTNMLIVLWLAFYHHQSETQTRCRQQTGTVGWRQ